MRALVVIRTYAADGGAGAGTTLSRLHPRLRLAAFIDFSRPFTAAGNRILSAFARVHRFQQSACVSGQIFHFTRSFKASVHNMDSSREGLATWENVFPISEKEFPRTV